MATRKGVKAEKPALTLNFDKEAAEDLEYISKLAGRDLADTVSFALGVLKKIAEEKQKGHKTYIESGSGRKEEILIFSPFPHDSQARQLNQLIRGFATLIGKSEKEAAEVLTRALREAQLDSIIKAAAKLQSQKGQNDG